MSPWAIAALAVSVYLGGWTVTTRQFVRNKWYLIPTGANSWSSLDGVATRAKFALMWPILAFIYFWWMGWQLVLLGIAGDLEKPEAFRKAVKGGHAVNCASQRGHRCNCCH